MILLISYPLETHYVTTNDGYVLTLFRLNGSNKIINKKEKKLSKNMDVLKYNKNIQNTVLLQHGLFVIKINIYLYNLINCIFY